MTSDPRSSRLHAEESFEDETFTGLDLQTVDLGHKEFYRCRFENCLLQESRWTGSRLEACVFVGCDLTRAQLTEAGLRGVTFERSKLMGIDWSNAASNPEVAFEGCNLRYASFAKVNLRQTRFLRCVARETNFLDADLSDADFSGTELAGSSILGCTLARTDFRTAIGVALDPARNRVRDTQVPVEAAVVLAQSLGFVVAGYGEPVSPKGTRKKR